MDNLPLNLIHAQESFPYFTPGHVNEFPLYYYSSVFSFHAATPMVNVTVEFLMQEYRVRESQGEVLVGIFVESEALTDTPVNLTITTMEKVTANRALGTTQGIPLPAHTVISQ